MVALHFAKILFTALAAPFRLLFRALKSLFNALKSFFSKIGSLFRLRKDAFRAIRKGPVHPKPLFESSRESAFLCCLVHLIPGLATITLIALNFLRFFISRELEGPGDQDGIKLGVLQVAAKVHELFIVASLGMVIFHVVRHELVSGAGLPLGLMGAGFSFSNPSFFATWDFWAGISYCHPSWLRKARFITLVVVSGLIAPIVGPASAALMIPRELDWKAGGARLWFDGTKDQIWPSKLISILPTTIDYTTFDYCLAQGREVIHENLVEWSRNARYAVPSFDTPGWPSRKIYARTRQSDQNQNSLEEDTWVFTSHNALSIQQQDIFLVWTNALHYLAQTESWWKFPGYKRLSKAAVKTATVETELPAVRVKCSPMSDIDPSGTVSLKFPVLPEYSETGNSPHRSQVLNVTDTIQRKLKANPGPDSSRVLTTGLQLPPLSGQSASFGIILINLKAPERQNGVLPAQACSIDGRWAKGKSFIKETTTNLQAVPIYYPRSATVEGVLGVDFIGSTTLSPPKDGTWRRANITTSWFNQLSPTESDGRQADGDGDSSSNQTAIEKIISPIFPHAGLDQRLEDTLWEAEFALGLFFVEGMSRAFCGVNPNSHRIEVGGILPLHGRIEPITMESLAGMGSKTKELVRSGDPLDPFHPPNITGQSEVRMVVSLNGYAMAAVGWFHFFCIAALLIHVIIALVHVAVLLWFGKDSSSWESIPELVALTLNSEPPKRVGELGLENTSAGIETFGPRQKMGWVESIDDNAATTGAQANPVIQEEQLQLRFGNSAPMTQGRPLGVSRVNTGQLYR